MKRSRVRSHSNGIDVADADEVAREQGHGRAAPSSGRPLLHRRFGADHASLLHDSASDEGDLPVEQEEARQPVSLYQVELLAQPGLHPLGDTAVPTHGGLVAEPFEIARGCVPVRYVGIGKGVAEVGAEVEGALFGN